MTTRVFPPVRPMDPAYFTPFMKSRKMDKKVISDFTKALEKYNKSCFKAADKLKTDFDRIMKML
jgi:hypothetical protein